MGSLEDNLRYGGVPCAGALRRLLVGVSLLQSQLTGGRTQTITP